jgi:CRP/FNR family transcriptional regulator, cyclic AMP receptor protein
VATTDELTDNDGRTAGAELLPHCADIPVITVSAGDVLIEQGSPPPAIFVLVEGAMAIERDGLVFSTIDYPGAIFGEMSTVMRRPATATVRATAPSTLHVARDPEGFLARPNVAVSVLRLTASRLEVVTRYLAAVRAQFDQLEGT